MDFDEVTEIVEGNLHLFEERIVRVKPQGDQLLHHDLHLVLEELGRAFQKLPLMAAFLDFIRKKLVPGNFQILLPVAAGVGLDIFASHVAHKL